MTPTIITASLDTLEFAHNLTRKNMAIYYARHGRVWDEATFRSSWPSTNNYCLMVDGRTVGILRCSSDDSALYIRDMQVLPEFQNCGAGSYALSFAEDLSKQQSLQKIRLRVFEDNPAKSLYLRTGFKEVSKKANIWLLEKAFT